jgi:hypothetical protein
LGHRPEQNGRIASQILVLGSIVLASSDESTTAMYLQKEVNSISRLLVSGKKPVNKRSGSIGAR